VRLAANLAALLFTCFAASAVEINGLVIAVQDGDTITFLDADKQQHGIRIAGIDAPEKAQPFGDRSTQNMARMAHRQDARADCPKTDHYGRKVREMGTVPKYF